MSNPRLKKNKCFPKGWRWKNGSIRFRVPAGMERYWDGKKEFTLGKTETEAYGTWHKRLHLNENTNLVSELLDRYLYEVVPKKAYATQISNRTSIRKLRPTFGLMRVADVKPHHIVKYMDIASQKYGITTTNHDLEVIRHVFSKAAIWGIINNNFIKKNVPKLQTAPRTRYIEDWEIEEVLNLKPKIKSRAVTLIKLYIELKLMTGLSRIDLLKLKLSDLKDNGIQYIRQKTIKTSAKQMIFEWDEEGELKELINEILLIPPRRIGDAHLFVTRQGKPYYNPKTMRCNAFDSIWQRFMDRVMKLTRVDDRFHEHDIRAKVGSDSKTLEEASERLAHSSTATTKRFYRRKPTRVQPLPRKKVK